jgi:hypothetical protein
VRAKGRDALEGRRNRPTDGRIPVKHGRKAIFDDDPDLEIGSKVVQDR